MNTQQAQDTNHAAACPPLSAGLEGGKPEHVIFWPAQCNCGHIFLEKYQFAELTKEGNIGFCWCGFCRTKRMVKPSNVQIEGLPASGQSLSNAGLAAEQRSKEL